LSIVALDHPSDLFSAGCAIAGLDVADCCAAAAGCCCWLLLLCDDDTLKANDQDMNTLKKCTGFR
jgi:hypothetical protein